MKTAKWLGTNLIAICGLFLLAELAVRILVPEITTQGTKNALERIVEINDVCRDWKIDFNLVLLPYEYQLRQPAPENLVPQKLMLAELQRRDIQVFDPFAGFNQRSDSKKYFLYGDGIHLSNCGHRFVAEFLLKQDEVLQF